MSKDFKKLPSDEQHWMLEELYDKMVSMDYDYSDIPDGSLGPKTFIGKVLHVGISTFTFDFYKPEDWGDVELTIEGIESIKVCEWH